MVYFLTSGRLYRVLCECCDGGVGEDWPVEKYDMVEGGEEDVWGFKGDDALCIGM